jgi:hypothetical protein
MIGGLPSGPDITVQFPFEPRAKQDLKGLMVLKGKELTYTRPFAERENINVDFEGFSESAKDYDIRVVNRKAGAGVRQTSDHGMSRLHFWSITTTVCPEPYTHIRVEPGKEFHWRVVFEFFKL